MYWWDLCYNRYCSLFAVAFVVAFVGLLRLLLRLLLRFSGIVAFVIASVVAAEAFINFLALCVSIVMNYLNSCSELPCL